MTDFEKVVDFNNMYKAYRRSKRGKGFRKSSAKFNVMALDGINKLINQLKERTYRISEYNEFKVYEPKERVIQTTSFKDKVIQHCLCDNVLLPKLQEIFILDNCAGQKGKGTLFGLNRLSEQMKEFYKELTQEEARIDLPFTQKSLFIKQEKPFALFLTAIVASK